MNPQWFFFILTDFDALPCHIIDSDFCAAYLMDSHLILSNEEREKYEALVLMIIICILNKERKKSLKKKEVYKFTIMKIISNSTLSWVLSRESHVALWGLNTMSSLTNFYHFKSFDHHIWHSLIDSVNSMRSF